MIAINFFRKIIIKLIIKNNIYIIIIINIFEKNFLLQKKKKKLMDGNKDIIYIKLNMITLNFCYNDAIQLLKV